MTRYNTPNLNIERPVPGSNEPHSTLMENAGWDKLDAGLGIRTFRWANDSARTAQAGMADGDEGYQANTQTTYKYVGGAWKVWTKALAGFVPVISVLTLGVGGTVSGHYWVTEGVAHYRILAILGSSGFAVGDVTLVAADLPVPLANVLGATLPIGTASFVDVSAGGNGRYLGVCWVGTRVVFLSPTNQMLSLVSAGFPFVWAAGDQLAAEFSGPVA